MVLLVSAALAPSAMAEWYRTCTTGDEAAYGNPFLSPTQGSAGSSFTVTGTAATWSSNVEVWWDTAGTPQLLGTLVNDGSGNYSGMVTVPADAAIGTYTVGLPHDRRTEAICLTIRSSRRFRPMLTPQQ